MLAAAAPPPPKNLTKDISQSEIKWDFNFEIQNNFMFI